MAKSALEKNIEFLASRIAITKKPLLISGGGNRLDYGEQVKDAVTFETDVLDQITAYEPTELYVTVGAGVKVLDLQEKLAKQNQQLCSEPACLPTDTVGGIYALGITGPSQPMAGSLRDHVLGCKIINGKGEIMSFGGTVIKNVAGYDVSRLMVGSLGTLALIAEITLRVRAISQLEITQSLECTAHDALQIANESAARGLPIAASCWHKGQLYLKFSGTESAVRRAALEIGGEQIEDAQDNFWYKLRDGNHQSFKDAKGIWLCHLPPFAELAIDDDGLIEWHGKRRWFFDLSVTEVREQVIAAGGSAVYYRRPKGNDTAVFVTPPPAVLDIQTRLKKSFDPKNILSPGRFSYL